jgi:hypothetical protein
VPKVLGWNATVENPVQSEYILMEEAKGAHLGETWDSLDTDAKYAITEDIVSVATKIFSVSFSR